MTRLPLTGQRKEYKRRLEPLPYSLSILLCSHACWTMDTAFSKLRSIHTPQTGTPGPSQRGQHRFPRAGWGNPGSQPLGVVQKRGCCLASAEAEVRGRGP